MEMEREIQRYTREIAVLREALKENSQRLEEKIHEFSLFRIVTDTINRLVTKDNSLKLLLAKMTEIIGAKNGSIMLIDEQTKELRVVAASGSKDSCPSFPAFPLGLGVAGWVARESKPLTIYDVTCSDRFYQDPRMNGQIRALVCLPLIFENKTIGVLNVSSDRVGVFTPNTERILHIIAGQVAIAIANSSSWMEQKKKERELLEKNRELEETKRQLQQAQAQVIRSQKLEAVRQMAISMHHEINNPLTTIYSCTQLLESHIHPGDEAGLESLRKIKESCEQIQNTVYKMSHIQEVVLTDYVADRKMVDIHRSSTSELNH